MDSHFLLQLLPDWTPTRSPCRLRIGALFKVPKGQTIHDPSAMLLQFLDAELNIISNKKNTLQTHTEALSGPTWLEIPGRLIYVNEEVKHLKGIHGEIYSDVVTCAEVNQTITLKPVGYDLGLPNEPHLWWRYMNSLEEPIAVEKIFRSTVLWLDEQALPIRPKTYNGPSYLPPRRALSGLWSLDDFNLHARWGKRLLQLEILGRRSIAISFPWN